MPLPVLSRFGSAVGVGAAEFAVAVAAVPPLGDGLAVELDSPPLPQAARQNEIVVTRTMRQGLCMRAGQALRGVFSFARRGSAFRLSAGLGPSMELSAEARRFATGNHACGGSADMLEVCAMFGRFASARLE